MKELDTMDQTANVSQLATLQDEIRRLQVELRTANRGLLQRDRTISVMENNFSVKMNMSRVLASENEKHKRFLAHLMRYNVDFLILLDLNLNIKYCSDIFLQKIGVKYIDEIEDKHILDVYRTFASGDLFEQIKGGIDLAIEKKEPLHVDVVADIENKNEYRAYRIIHIPIFENGLHGLIIDWSDTTDIIDAKNAAEEASKSKSRFLATMSHEIRTPLNAIIGIAQIELHRGSLPDGFATALEKINSSSNHLLGIINDILDLSKIETGKLGLVITEYDIPSLINDAVQLNTVRLGSKMIAFKLDINETLPQKLLGDELRLKQVLNNLLSNAIKYTEKGYVKLSVSHITEGEEVTLRFIVEDTGQGMTLDDQQRLFSEYLRFNADSNRTTEGTGLGLNITKKLVEMMNGSIQVQSEYGKGTVFTVEVKQKAVECAAIGPTTSAALSSFSYKDTKQADQQFVCEPMPYGAVLVVDDVEINLYVAEGMLLPYGLNVEIVTSGFEAIDKVKEGEVYDIIFMDHMMPKMDGIETTKKLRAGGYKGAIVALTANALVGNEDMFFQNGFDGFISKPVDIWHMDSILKKFVRDRHAVPQNAYHF